MPNTTTATAPPASPAGRRQGVQRRRRRQLSEYGKELQEKQKMKNIYNIREKQFRNYVKKALAGRSKVEDTGELLVRSLEGRLDNVVFRLGFASTRAQARQMVSHGHFLVNGKVVTIPSLQVKKGDRIMLASRAQKRDLFQNISIILKKHKCPSWMKLNVEKLEAEIVGEVTLKEAAIPVEISAIFEFYSR